MTDFHECVGRGGLALASLSLVALMACGGAPPAAPAQEMETGMADAGLASDFIEGPRS